MPNRRNLSNNRDTGEDLDMPSGPVTDTTRDFWTIKQLADRWQVSEKKVQRMIAKGDLVAHRFDRLVRVSQGDAIACERIHRMG